MQTMSPVQMMGGASGFEEDDPWPVGMYSPTAMRQSDRRPQDIRDSKPVQTQRVADIAFASTDRPPVSAPPKPQPEKASFENSRLNDSPVKAPPPSRVYSNEASILLASSSTLETEWESVLLAPGLKVFCFCFYL